MIKLISWIYHSIFDGYKCDCCKKYANSIGIIIGGTKNGAFVTLCYKCLGAHDHLNEAMREMCEQLGAQSFRRFL